MSIDGATTDRRLTEVGYWDGVHAAEDMAWSRTGTPVKARLKKLLGPRLLASMRAYDDYLLWDVIFPPELGPRAGQRVVEIGSAPGEFVARLHERFGLDPYGIEYSHPGADLNRRLFAAAGLDPAHVIEADFFAPEIQERYRESFDVVLSRGFVEHFSDVDEVVGKHLNLLKPGGLLVVLIPNLRGVNLALSWLFHREVVAMHNLDIMTRERFGSLFSGARVDRVFCDYVGTFNFCLFNARPDSLMRLPLAACMKAQPLLNALFRLLFKDKGVESPWLSPNLLFIGTKR